MLEKCQKKYQDVKEFRLLRQKAHSDDRMEQPFCTGQRAASRPLATIGTLPICTTSDENVGKPTRGHTTISGSPCVSGGWPPPHALARTMLYSSRPQRFGHMAGWVSPPPARASPKFPSPWLLRTGFGCRNGVLAKGAVFVFVQHVCNMS